MLNRTEQPQKRFETAVADLGPDVIYATGQRGDFTLLVMNTDEHLARIPTARNLMQRPELHRGL